MRTRRSFMAVTGVSLLGGCSGLSGSTPTATPDLDSDGDGVVDERDDYPNNYTYAYRVLEKDGVEEIAPGSHEAFRFQWDRDTPLIISYDLIVESSGGIDVFLLDRENYIDYTNGGDVSYYDSPSAIGVGSATVEKVLLEGRYVLVFDNTTLETPPGDVEAVVDYEITVAASGPDA